MAEWVSKFRGRDTELSKYFPFSKYFNHAGRDSGERSIGLNDFLECNLNSSLDFNL